MTQLLVSVRSAIEAIAALGGGADWIDIKEPLKGSLGAVGASTIDEIVQVVNGRAPVSMACGELTELQVLNAQSGIQLAKCGLAGGGVNWRQTWLRWSNNLPTSCRAVLVAYAEESRAKAPPIADIVSFAIEVRPAVVLIDTAIKDHRTLSDHWALENLTTILEPLSNASIPFALAGSLRLEQLVTVLALNPGWIAVRGAVCEGGRNGVVSAEKVRVWKTAIQRNQARLVGNLDKS